MGGAAYEGMAGALPTADHPFSRITNAARKVVFSQTLTTAEWANTPPSPLVIPQERSTGSGEAPPATSVVWGGVSFWRSLLRPDLIDEFRLDLYP